MELEQLRTFAAAARLGSLSAASAAVNLSQPAVSRQIQGLERRLGARLLERGARGVQLTEAGEAVARGAADVLSRLEELDEELVLLRGGEGGTLRVGATVTVCLYLLPPLLRCYRERYPRQEIMIINDRSRQIPELVRERRIDVGISSSTLPPLGVRRIPWQELSLVLLGPSSGPYPHSDPALSCLLQEAVPSTTAKESHSLSRSLTPSSFVLATPGSLRTLTEQVLARAGIEPRVVAEADSLEVVKQLIRDGFGYALVPEACVTNDDWAAGLCAYPLANDAPRLPVVLWHRGGPFLSQAVRNFLALASEPD